MAGRRVEMQLASRFLNTMTRLGVPDSYHAGQVCLGERGISVQFRTTQQCHADIQPFHSSWSAFGYQPFVIP